MFAFTTSGTLRLDTVAGVPIDVGAESMLARRPEALALVRELRLDDRVTHPAAVAASIVSGGRRWPLPRGTLMGVPSDIEALRGLLTDAEVDRAAAERISRVDGDVAVGAFVDGRLGRAVTDKLVEPLLAGVYAGHSRAISLEVAVPAMFAAAREGRSVVELAGQVARAAAENATPVFATLVGGLGTLPTLLVDALCRRGVQVRTGTTARALRPHGDRAWVLTTGPTTDAVDEVFDAVVLATPAAPNPRSMRISVISPPNECPMGSGFLVPPTEPLTIKAATFSSVKWPWLAAAHPDTTFLRASVGRFGEVSTLQRPDADLVEIALRDLATVLGRPLPTPVDTQVQRWGGGLPQYAVGHRARVAAARAPAAGVAVSTGGYPRHGSFDRLGMMGS